MQQLIEFYIGLVTMFLAHIEVNAFYTTRSKSVTVRYLDHGHDSSFLVVVSGLDLPVHTGTVRAHQ